MTDQSTLPWYKRFAHRQRDFSRALRYRWRNGATGLISARGVARTILKEKHDTHASVRDEIEDRRAFLESQMFDDLVSKAAALDPNIEPPRKNQPTYMAPWHDLSFFSVRDAIELLPEGPFDTVILVPFGKLGGADFVAGILARTLQDQGRVLILRTDQSDWERPDWYPEDVPAVDLSPALAQLHEGPRALYSLIQRINPAAVYNVNSRLGFRCFKEFGARLKRDTRLYAYFFCADRTPDDREIGYPVWFAAEVIPHLRAALVDSGNLAETLAERYAVPSTYAGRLRTIYTPATGPAPDRPLVEAQIATRSDRERPLILWAGRLDRQKRFDLVVDIATAMPDVDFQAWGKAVLDKPVKQKDLPPNLTLNPPFGNLDELPLSASDGWLYTSAWDGLPTILIELAARGVPVVASAVGGVPELVDETTGWPVEDWRDPQAYVAEIRKMLSDPAQRRKRAVDLQQRARVRHTIECYRSRLAEIE